MRPDCRRRDRRQGSFYRPSSLPSSLFAAFPFYWMLITTFKKDGDLYNLQVQSRSGSTLPPTLEHSSCLFSQTRCSCTGWSTRSLIGVCVVAITLVVALPAGYAWRGCRPQRPRTWASGSS